MSAGGQSESVDNGAAKAPRTRIDFAARKKRSDAAAAAVATALRDDKLNGVLYQLFKIIDLTETQFTWEDFANQLALECGQYGYSLYSYIGFKDIIGVTRLSSPKLLKIKLERGQGEEIVVAIVIVDAANGQILRDFPEEVLEGWRKIDDAKLQEQLLDLLCTHIRNCQGRLSRKPQTEGLSKQFVQTCFGFAVHTGFRCNEGTIATGDSALGKLVEEANFAFEMNQESYRIALAPVKQRNALVFQLRWDEDQEIQFKINLKFNKTNNLVLLPSARERTEAAQSEEEESSIQSLPEKEEASAGSLVSNEGGSRVIDDLATSEPSKETVENAETEQLAPEPAKSEQTVSSTNGTANTPIPAENKQDQRVTGSHNLQAIPQVRTNTSSSAASQRPILPELFLSINPVQERVHEMRDDKEIIAGGKTFRELQALLNDPSGREEAKRLVEEELELPPNTLMPQILHLARIQAHKGGKFGPLLAIVRALM